MSRASLLPDATLDYHKRSLYLFVPNVCDARCQFCYMEPAYSESAKISRHSLTGVARLAADLSTWGFREIRITGGEPLIFRNLDSLADVITSAGMDYALFTNGLKLAEWTPLFLKAPPRKITISVHALKGAESWFGVEEWPTADVLAQIPRLRAAGVKVCVSAVFMGDPDSLRSLFTKSRSLGASEFKIIFPNMPAGPSRPEPSEFASAVDMIVAENRDEIGLKWTDLDADDCLLRERGHLSMALPSQVVSACCVQVGNPRYALGAAFDGPQLRSLIAGSDTSHSLSSGFPCLTYTNSCPIAYRRSR